MSDFSKDININKIIELIKSSANKQTPDYKSTYRQIYLQHLQKIAMSQYKSNIDMLIKQEQKQKQKQEREEVQVQEEVQEQKQKQVREEEREKKGEREEEREEEEEEEKKKKFFNPFPCITSYWQTNEYKLAYEKIIRLIIDNTSGKAKAEAEAEAQTYIENLKRITKNCNKYIDTLDIKN